MNKIITIINEEPFTGEDGNAYLKITKEIKTPRKTYIRGLLSGKYRGNQITNDQFHNTSLFDFEIYEAIVDCRHPEDFQKNQPFAVNSRNIFPKDKLPKTLLVQLTTQNSSFGINILEPIVYDFDTIRKLHQTEGDEVFGSFTARITGYVFDYETEIVEEYLLVPEIIHTSSPLVQTKKCECSSIETGEAERVGNNVRKEYYCKHHNDTTWGKWKYEKATPTSSLGCWSSISWIIGLILVILFLMAILPGLIYIIPLFIFFFLLNILAPYLKWIFRIIGIFLLCLFIGSLFNSFRQSSSHYVPQPKIVDSQKETKSEIIPIITPDTHSPEKPSITNNMIKRYRVWSDYDNNKYEGFYFIMQNDLNNSSYFKKNVSIEQNSINTYDKIIFNLKENDKNKLDGLYHLFDSINNQNKLSKVKFAEMVVSFVQDIPYVIILEKGCNASLYSDRFTRNYLLNPNSICDGYQRFGINTPVEFLANLKGDCDSRTVLLYTIFSHYDYDVAVLSSEVYGHSILGINLPVNGTAYVYRSQRYVMWETTAPDCKPGIIPNEISNTNNWRISLKSK
jgi:energy-coupling factor transporter transmembrane protein EcfT